MECSRAHESVVHIASQASPPTQGHGPDQAGRTILGQSLRQARSSPSQKPLAPGHHVRRPRAQLPISRSLASQLEADALSAKEGGVIEQTGSHRAWWRGDQARDFYRLSAEKSPIRDALTADHHLARSGFPRLVLRTPLSDLKPNHGSFHPLSFAL